MLKLTRQELMELIRTKLYRAGLTGDHAEKVADVLVHADERGVHSHGAMRVEYYAERIAKGTINTSPIFTFEKTGHCSAIYDGDNGVGHVAADLAMDEAIKMAKETGIGIVGVRRISHSGALSYLVEKVVKSNLIGLSVCQSNPMVVPFGGAEPYYGTNPIAFSAPGNGEDKIIFDMATTVQGWGEVLHSRSKNEPISDTWAVDNSGEPTMNPCKVNALLPIASPKGYGLMMMVDVLLLGLPFGNKVTSMYEDLTEHRNLDQLHIVINPEFFTGLADCEENRTTTMTDMNEGKPAPGFEQVSYPRQRIISGEREIEIEDDVYQYLISDTIHTYAYDNENCFC